MSDRDFELVGAALDAFEQFVWQRESGINGHFQLNDVKAALARIEAKYTRLCAEHYVSDRRLTESEKRRGEALTGSEE